MRSVAAQPNLVIVLLHLTDVTGKLLASKKPFFAQTQENFGNDTTIANPHSEESPQCTIPVIDC